MAGGKRGITFLLARLIYCGMDDRGILFVLILAMILFVILSVSTRDMLTLLALAAILFFAMRGKAGPKVAAGDTESAPAAAETAPAAAPAITPKEMPVEHSLDELPATTDWVPEAPIALTLDAAGAYHAIRRSRDKRMWDSIASRTVDFYRRYFDDEFDRNENRIWWEAPDYPIDC